ncbi:FkbM family methyltransferase [Streptomyces sp. NPDC101455]|uniref:FkbM family methyltransferase n=1 Tax=Streptomyces sp. NPDC101455 TaxID=3366142 RepID=UPI0037F1E081
MIPNAALGALRAYVRHAPGTAGKRLLLDRYLNDALTRRPHTALARTRTGDRFPVTTSDVIQRYLYLFGVWEPNLTAWLSRRLRPGETFVDVGANIGYYTLLASRLVGPTGRVISIEASPAFHQALTSAARDNGCHNIRSANTAVSATAETLTFYLEHSTNLGGTTAALRPRTVESSFQMDALPLPQVLQGDELDRARVIKVDVEGAEASLMHGLAPALDRLRDDAELVIEVTPRLLSKQGQDVEEVLAPLREHGFHLYKLTNDYAAGSYPTAQRRPAAPVRWDQSITEMSDLIFSRTNAATLP